MHRARHDAGPVDLAAVSAPPRRPLPPAVVVGAEDGPSLGAARPLARRGIEVIGVAADLAPATCGCSCWSAVLHEREVYGEATAIDALLRVGRQVGGRPVLFATRDQTVQVVSEHRARIADYFDVLLPPQEIVQIFLDKTLFHGWAKEHGFPVPDTTVVTSAGDVRRAMRVQDGPVVLKPWRRTAHWHRSLNPIEKALVLRRPEDVEALPPELFEQAGPLVLQRWIDGGDRDVWFCLAWAGRQDGQVRLSTGQKLLQWPVGLGSTAICRSAPNPELEELCRSVLRAAEFRGLGSLEVKYDRRDGRPYITEPTVGRVDLQSEIAVLAGEDLPATAYAGTVGLACPPPARRTRPSVVLIVEKNAACALRQVLRAGPLDLRFLLLALWRADRVRGSVLGRRDVPVLRRAVARQARDWAALLRRSR